jgi:cell shape-determining protein MreC
MVFISFLLCACVLLLMPQRVTTKLQFIFSSLFRLPLGTGRVVLLAAQSPGPSSDMRGDDYEKLQRENLELQNHNDNLMALLDQMHNEKEKLSKVNLLHAWDPHGFVLAGVIQALAGSDQIIINRGLRDKLAPGQYILANNAIVGSVFQLDKHVATATLITDESSYIPVFIKSVQADHTGFLRGLGNGKAKAQGIAYQHKIAVGDRVHVQTKPGLLEVPAVVGTVLQCQRDEIEPLLWDITVEPASDLKRLSQVYVIVGRAQQE